MTNLAIFTLNSNPKNVSAPVRYSVHGYVDAEDLQRQLQARNREVCTSGWNKHCRRYGLDYKTVRPIPGGVVIFKHSPLRNYKRIVHQIIVLEN